MTIRCPICNKIMTYSRYNNRHHVTHNMSFFEFRELVRAQLSNEAKKLITNHA